MITNQIEPMSRLEKVFDQFASIRPQYITIQYCLQHRTMMYRGKAFGIQIKIRYTEETWCCLQIIESLFYCNEKCKGHNDRKEIYALETTRQKDEDGNKENGIIFNGAFDIRNTMAFLSGLEWSDDKHLEINQDCTNEPRSLSNIFVLVGNNCNK